jgi:heme/copper-type cytochrome/quinol oxidase subunit 1
MSNRAVAGIVAATAALLWIVFGIPVMPTVLAAFVGWWHLLLLEFAVDGALVALVAVLVLRSQRRLLDAPALWAAGAILIVLTNAAQGIMLARADANPLQDVYYIVAHIRYATHMSAMFCLFAGFYALFPRVSGWTYSRPLANLQFALMLAGFAIATSTWLALLLAPMPQRYRDLDGWFSRWNQVASAGALVMAAGAATFLVVLAHAFLRRRPAAE